MKRIDFNHHLPIGSSGNDFKEQLPVAAVDRIADELVAEYNNPDYRKWYCKIIYEFGPSKVAEWRRKSAEGRQPAKLFSKYVKDARAFTSPTKHLETKDG